MAVTFLILTVSNPEKPKKAEECEFLVDSGAIYSVMPRDILRRLGIHPSFSAEFILANGENVKWPVGNALFSYKGKKVAAPVVFGEKGVFLLGATTLESLGMILDPIRRELKPLPMVLM